MHFLVVIMLCVCCFSLIQHICASKQIKSQTVDLIMIEEYGDIDPSKDPLVLLDCGHMQVSTLNSINDLLTDDLFSQTAKKFTNFAACLSVCLSGSQ